MIKISEIKVSEVARMTDSSIPLISRYFKSREVTRINNRIVGISPEAIENYFKSSGLDYFYRPAILLFANLCGGVGKTTSAYNLGAALRRITSRDTPIIFVDGDPQGSLTSNIFGQPADYQELILIDFLQGRAGIDDILTEVNDNIWIVKSNLNHLYLDKTLDKPKDIKDAMARFYSALFNKFGNKAKILQDHTPQLSNLFASSFCALNQLDDSILKSVLIPLRGDKYAIQGADYILKEIHDLNKTFSLDNNSHIHCFFSSIDKRISTTAQAIKFASSKENIVQHLSSVVVRYCSEIPKGIMAHTNVYTSGKNNNAAEDYQDLLQYIFNYDQIKDN